MELVVAQFSQHGLLAVFLAVFLEQLGAPIPSLPFLLLAGVEAARGGTFALEALALATLAALLANSAWFVAGRLLGRRVLATLCWISISPDTCVRQSELSFSRRGKSTLIIAKFVPGLSILAPPLAGALGMHVRTFVVFNLAGSLLWAGAGIGTGLVFQAQIHELFALLSGLGSMALALAAGLLVVYLVWRLWRRSRVLRTLLDFERVDADELAALVARGQEVVIVDVRAESPELPLTGRIPGAEHLDLANMDHATIARWPATAELFTYCACPNDASAVKAAQWLKEQGRHARVLTGGIESWARAGHPVEALRELPALVRSPPTPEVSSPVG